MSNPSHALKNKFDILQLSLNDLYMYIHTRKTKFFFFNKNPKVFSVVASIRELDYENPDAENDKMTRWCMQEPVIIPNTYCNRQISSFFPPLLYLLGLPRATILGECSLKTLRITSCLNKNKKYVTLTPSNISVGTYYKDMIL